MGDDLRLKDSFTLAPVKAAGAGVGSDSWGRPALSKRSHEVLQEALRRRLCAILFPHGFVTLRPSRLWSSRDCDDLYCDLRLWPYREFDERQLGLPRVQIFHTRGCGRWPV